MKSSRIMASACPSRSAVCILLSCFWSTTKDDYFRSPNCVVIECGPVHISVCEFSHQAIWRGLSDIGTTHCHRFVSNGRPFFMTGTRQNLWQVRQIYLFLGHFQIRIWEDARLYFTKISFNWSLYLLEKTNPQQLLTTAFVLRLCHRNPFSLTHHRLVRTLKVLNALGMDRI